MSTAFSGSTIKSRDIDDGRWVRNDKVWRAALGGQQAKPSLL